MEVGRGKEGNGSRMQAKDMEGERKARRGKSKVEVGRRKEGNGGSDEFRVEVGRGKEGKGGEAK